MPKLTPQKQISLLVQESGIAQAAVTRVLASMAGIPRGQIAAMIDQALEDLDGQDAFARMEHPVILQEPTHLGILDDMEHEAKYPPGTFRTMKDITPPEDN